MAIDNIPEVKVRLAAAQRYIVAKLVRGLDSQLVIRAAYYKRPYEDIIAALETEAHEAKCHVILLGGGKVSASDDTSITLYTDESRKDEEREAVTVPLLQKEFPNLKIKCAGVV